MARRSSKAAPNLLDLLEQLSPEEETGPALRDRTSALARDQLQLETLEIENFWSYRQAVVQFEPGTTVIAGPNGSGKSSLLESIFFALYGSEARHIMGRGLDEILRIGAGTGSVKLSFLYGGHRYTAQIALRRQKTATKSERDGCQLSCDDGTVWMGVVDVTAEIEKLFGMDREGFTNCIYVRQGEIDKLIRADRKTREQMLDGLLGLYKLDLFVSPRSKEAQRALNRRLELLAERIARWRREIEALENEELGKQKQQLTEQIEAVQVELKTLDEDRADAYKLLQSYEESLKRFQQVQRELQQTEKEFFEKERRLAQREHERRALEEELEALTTRQQKALLSIKTSLQKWEIDLVKALQSLEQATTLEEISWIFAALAESRTRIEAQRYSVQELREAAARLSAEQTQRERALAQLREEEGELKRLLQRETEQIYQSEQELARLQDAQVVQERKLQETLSALQSEIDKLGIPGLFYQHPAPGEGWGEGSRPWPGFELSQAAALRTAWAQDGAVLEAQNEQAHRAVLEIKTQYDLLRRERERKQQLLAEGRCPTCGQSLKTGHFAESLEHLRPRLAELERLVKDEERSLEQIEERMAIWKRAQTLLDALLLAGERFQGRRQERSLQEHNLQNAQERGQELEAKRQELQKRLQSETEMIVALQAQQEELQKQWQSSNQRLEEFLASYEQLEKTRGELDQFLRLRAQGCAKQAARKTLLDSLNELRGDLARLQDRLAQLRERLQREAENEGKKAQVQEFLAKLDEQRAAAQGRYERLAQARGVVQGRLEQLARLKQEFEQVLQDQLHLEKLQTELTEIVSVYQTTKLELRKRNLAALNYYFNEFFSLMDSGDSYRRVLVRDDYEIEVELKNGSKLNPALLSGGERALTNIALRCAIHQVLARAVRRMPLILDEPTIYLDRERIHRLQFLLEDLGRRVGQVIVVSHEVGLVEGADHEYRTEKGSDNISRICKVR